MMYFVPRFEPKDGCQTATSSFSVMGIGLQGLVISATRQPIVHILDWFHPSMRRS
jgi:hypothetical protein